MVFLDGVYTTTPWGKSRFHHIHAVNPRELTELVDTISHRAAAQAKSKPDPISRRIRTQ
jgi:hypothetical protein